MIALAAGAAWPARAQNFPSALIRIVVPAAPGGGTDILARAMSQQLQTMWGQTVIVENRSGGGGLIGTKQVIAAPGDGHTLLMAATSAIMSLAVNTPSPFEISRDLAPISLVSAPPYILVAHPSVPAKNAAELIEHAKKMPARWPTAPPAQAPPRTCRAHCSHRWRASRCCTCPIAARGPAVTDLLGGRIQLLFSPAITVTPHIAAGTLRVIGTTGATRSSLFPDFPTIAESGLPKYDSLGWFGLFAPGTTPPALAERISGDVRTVLVSDDLKKRLAEQGAEPAPTTPAEFKSFVNADITKWLDLAKKAGITLGG